MSGTDVADPVQRTGGGAERRRLRSGVLSAGPSAPPSCGPGRRHRGGHPGGDGQAAQRRPRHLLRGDGQEQHLAGLHHRQSVDPPGDYHVFFVRQVQPVEVGNAALNGVTKSWGAKTRTTCCGSSSSTAACEARGSGESSGSSRSPAAGESGHRSPATGAGLASRWPSGSRTGRPRTRDFGRPR
jgi:hypothetical protein